MISTKALNHQVALGDSTLNILKNIDLHIESGESVAIVGASGSGKSTLLGLLAGLDSPSSGSITLNQTDITQLDEEQRAELRAKYVSFIFQNFQLLNSLTALENVMLPLEIHQRQAPRETAERYLSRVGLEHRLTHYPQQLSGGEQQRVAIARAFACKAPILFADEPTGNLDSETGKTISDLLFELNEESHTTLVLVTHDAQLANRCGRTLFMHGGCLSEEPRKAP